MKFLRETLGAPIIWFGVGILFVGLIITGTEYADKVVNKIKI